MSKKRLSAKTYVMIAVSCLVAFFILFNLFRVGYRSVKTETALSTQVYKTVDTEIFAIRRESVLPVSGYGFTVPLVANGERVAKNQAIAAVFATEEAAQNYTKYLELQDEISYYEKLSASSVSQYSDTDRLESDIDRAILDYIADISSGDIENAHRNSFDVRANLISKQSADGVNIDYNGIIENLKSNSSAALALAGGFSQVYSTEAGYYLNECDGFENTVSFDDAVSLTVDKIDGLTSLAPPTGNEMPSGKIITEFGWYFVCNIDVNDIGDITVGSQKEISLPYSSVDDFTATVYQINDTVNGKTAVVFYVADINADLASVRNEIASVKIESYNGYKIPNTAIRTVDGVKGVYILRNNLVSFKKIDIFYSDDDYSVVGNTDDKSGYIRLYDDVILEGADLYDGKLLS